VSGAGSSSGADASRGELVIVTGSSHVGKSTLIRELLARSERAAAHVSIDATIEVIEIEEVDRWEHGLHIAYEEAAGEAGDRLARGEVVFFESTFTYVPPDSRPAQFHLHELERLVDLAEGLGAGVTLVHLFAGLDDVAARRAESGRLTEEIIRTTWHQHADRNLARPAVLQINTSQLSIGQVADRVWTELVKRAQLA
jgi:predicted kinase